MFFSRPQQYKMAKYCDEIFGELLLKVQSTFLSQSFITEISAFQENVFHSFKKMYFGQETVFQSLKKLYFRSHY